MKNYIYQINKEQDYIRIYSTKLTTTYVSVYKEKGTWEVEHWSGNRKLEETKIYAELILHACSIADELKVINNKLVFERLLN